MAILPIVTAPDSRLKIKSFPVPEVTDDIRKLMDDMLETMYHAQGIGLAAVQVGVHKRILVMDLQERDENKHGPYYLVNPQIIESSNTLSSYDEGCLSFPEQQSTVFRPERVTVKYLDYQGKEQVLEATGLLATCVQHEIDHLNGIVFVDHLSPVRRELIMRKVRKVKKRQPPA